MNATIFDIQRASFVDGPGIRTTVFFKGCHLRCKWCHNPESQNPHPEIMVHKSKCTGCGKCAEICPHHLAKCDVCGKCVAACPAGARQIYGYAKSIEDIVAEVKKDKAFYEPSGGGVTVSGGECMLQIDALTELLAKCKENGIHTAVDTAGDVPWAYFEKILPFTDLFLYDVKCFDEDLHKKYVGVSNQQILANLQGLLRAGAAVLVRIPIIGGVNDTEEEMRAICQFLKSCSAPVRVELLPYHAMGEHKYAAIGREAIAFSVPGEETMARLRAVFAEDFVK